MSSEVEAEAAGGDHEVRPAKRDLYRLAIASAVSGTVSCRVGM